VGAFEHRERKSSRPVTDNSLSLPSGKQLDRCQMKTLVHVLFQPGDKLTTLHALTVHTACEMLLQGFTGERSGFIIEHLKSQVTDDQCLIFTFIESYWEYSSDDEMHLAVRSWCRLFHSLGVSGTLDFESYLEAFFEERHANPYICPAESLTLTVATIDSQALSEVFTCQGGDLPYDA
jgi:hypothetical protein